MKKYILVLLLIIFLLVAITIVIDMKIHLARLEEQIKTEFYKYLEERYTEKMYIYHVVTTDRRALVCLADSSNTRFQVVGAGEKTASKYFDTYLQECLRKEAKETIQNSLVNENFNGFKINVSEFYAPPFIFWEELYECYQKLGRPPTLQEISKERKIDRIAIYFSKEDFSEEKMEVLENTLRNLEIPVEEFEVYIDNHRISTLSF